jgi:hypothetical protein
MTTAPRQLVYQFTMTLQEITPAIWRRLQVPATYTFWVLHVALQDAMGWLDYHLHVFRLRRPPKQIWIEIGIPDDEGSDDQVLSGWEISLRTYFTVPGQTASYLYDFGDGWHHEVVLEGILLKEHGVKYPRCLAGARACPPEDCGSVPGYERLLDILRHPGHADYQDTIAWLKGHAKNYYPYDPEAFDPGHIVFTNPKRRWRRAFVEPEDR